MSTVVQEEQEPRQVTPSDWEATMSKYGIEDPWLQELGHAMFHDLSELGARAQEYGTLRELAGLETPIVDQTTVNELVDMIAGEDARQQVTTLAGLYKSLDKPLEKDDSTTLLHDTYGFAVFTDATEDSRKGRRNLGKHVVKTSKLTEYWQAETTTDSQFRIGEDEETAIRESIIKPIAELFTELPDTDDSEFTDELRRRLQAMDTVSMGTELAPLKFLVATEVIRAYGQPQIISTLARSNGSTVREIAANPQAKLYFATDILGHYSHNEPEKAARNLNALHQQNISKRPIPFTSRKFKQAYTQLRELCFLYDDLHSAEQMLNRIPNAREAYRNAVNTHDGLSVDAYTLELTNISSSAFDSMIEQLNPRLADQSNEVRQRLWHQANGFDRLRIVLTKEVLKRLQNWGVKIGPAHTDAIETMLQPMVELQLAKFHNEHNLATLRTEIDARLLQLDYIDKPYHLTNNQLRHRAPETIGLAKVLSESIKDHEPLPIEAARSVVALMRGAYSEQWGSATKDYAAMIKKYLVDAQDLRELSLDLEFFGQPKQSKLAETLNLLDELIDSGTFDNLEARPELAVFEDFLLEYLIATAETATQEVEPLPETETVPPANETEEPDEPEIPIETIGQADYEDLLVFPPGTSEKDIIQDYVRGVSEADLPSIEWGRITRLIELRNKLTDQGLAVQFMRTKHASWQVLPFFILEARLPEAKRPVVVVESPVYGNATYIYREAAERPEWREVVQLSRRDARELGAVPMVHVDGTRLDIHFRKVWNRLISEMTIRQ